MIVTSKRILIGSLVISSFLATQTIVSAQQSSPTLDRLRSTKTIRIAYRPDAPPFSFKSSLNEPTGYIVELCKAVAAQIGQQLNVSLSPVYVPVSSVDRFDAIRQGKADMLCYATH